ncbi:serine/threonine protein kinase [Beggiatoa leptomitoformis]|uniref:Protein kinase domain-containing protein n=1 Tax=Beggiatoa leptomitoformis TaxID=288004 RepID=A0A2N9YB79_9GAMM|nr:serine/threonine protein kinase [Beggiatoa leptomitoformis]ALG66902.2 hypothetical protein AL038_03180 [Beggiatoa leptomitoformis]AUI67737.2 hypothetical protein BLE401_02850 [Beggiatoa leptomitoformis]
MDYYMQGGGKVKLVDTDFVAEGGEGKIYVKNKTVYKIYTDIARVMPVAKIQELNVLDHPCIVRPLALLLDKNNQPVGFTMLQAVNTQSLPRLFTNDFRQQQNISDSMIFALLEKMHETIHFIHQHHCLMVDGNEMNYLVDTQTWEKPYFIDVDSYQTPHFPATALMPSIKDYHTQGFSPLTDWFAFAIVACQLLVGIHPYKGKHANHKGLESRMKANISIFNATVSLPAAVRDFAIIPSTWQDWFIRLFEKGERLAPPLLSGKLPAPALRVHVVQGTNNFTVTLLHDYKEPIREHHYYNGLNTIFVKNTVYIQKQPFSLQNTTTQIIYEPRSLTALAATIHQQQLQLTVLSTGEVLALTLNAEQLLCVNNNLYVVQYDKLITIQLRQVNDKLFASSGTVWQIMPNSHQVFQGIIYQNVLGKPYLVIPYQQSCAILAVPELMGYKLINAKHDKGVVMLMGRKNGQYDEIIIRFNDNYSQYDVRVLENRDILESNFVTLDNGVVIHIPEEGEMHIFHRQANAMKTIKDPFIRTSMRLCHEGTSVLFYEGTTLFGMKMK